MTTIAQHHITANSTHFEQSYSDGGDKSQVELGYGQTRAKDESDNAK